MATLGMLGEGSEVSSYDARGLRLYLRDPWNILDFTIVIASLVMLLGIPQLKPLRVLRALRPLRRVSRSPGMKLMVSSEML